MDLGAHRFPLNSFGLFLTSPERILAGLQLSFVMTAFPIVHTPYESLLKKLIMMRSRMVSLLVFPMALFASSLFGQDDPIVPGNDPLDPNKESSYIATPTEDVSGGGRFYWVIFREPEPGETEADGWDIDEAVVARGTMYFDGIESIILAPQTTYRMWAIYAENLSVGTQSFTTPRSGESFEIPRIGFYNFSDDEDEDGDLIGRIGEFIIGTNPLNADTDTDGVNDGAEVIQGLNPLDGLIAATGVIATAPTPGPAEDICASNNIVIVACGVSGVVIFNVESSDAPTRIGQVDTPGDAQAVACHGTLLAVADGSSGLTVIDISDPAAAAVKFTASMPASATSVATLGNFAFVGLSNGVVVAIDMLTGEELDRRSNTSGWGSVQDVGVIDSLLYVLQVGRLSVYEIIDGELEYIRNISAPGGVGAGQRRLRLFLGKDFALSSFLSGFNYFDLSDPFSPTRVEDYTNSQRGWKQIVSNGDGIGIAAVSNNSTNDGAHDVSYFDLGDDPSNATFVTEYPTPGLAAAVTLYNGLAYVADSAEGLQVINYLSFDHMGIPPVIEMMVDAPDDEVEEGKVATVEVDVSDDVQVRSVTFFIDGEPAYTDGNYPYSFSLIAPLIADTLTGTFEIHAEAIDTGGNRAATPAITLTLVPDNTPPRVRSFSPKSGSFVGSIQAASAAFNELMNEQTLNSSSIKLLEAGPDGVLGGADDVSLPIVTAYEETTFHLVLDPGMLLPPGLYQAVVKSPAADVAGNVIERTYTSTFRVFDFVDADRDGVPDDIEADLGLDPNNPDSNGNNIPDGLEDLDGDGLPLSGEIFLGTDPTVKDSDGNGVEDGDEDTDLDGLTDGEEILLGTDPTKVDSDGDLIDDPTEIAAGYDPNDPGSRFPAYVGSGVVAYINGVAVNVDDVLDYTAVSPVVSYVNGIVDSGPGGEELTYTVVSPTISYVNGVVGSEQATYYVTSPIISYENN
jgi:hypothetical protein